MKDFSKNLRPPAVAIRGSRYSLRPRPERFFRHPPPPSTLARAAWINKPEHVPGMVA